MEKRTREILALVLLVLLGLAAAGTMAWYILVGHSWNQAATRIDDLVGSMDDYTVIAYAGVVKRPQKTEGQAGAAGQAGQAGAGAVSSAQAASSTSAKRLKLSTVARSYRKKGASVIAVPKAYENAYDRPAILWRGGKRVGVFAFDGKYRYSFPKFNRSLHYLQAHEVDYVVAVVRDKALAKHPPEGVDLLVVMRDAGLPEGGEMRGRTFCVDSPYKGEVQAVIVSPSGVVSSRTLRKG